MKYRGEQPLMHRAGGFTGAAACRDCHLDHHASWSRTWHSTMTQSARAETVQGAFDGRPVRFYGLVARPYRDADRFYMDLPVNGGGRRVAQVQLTVGSHRYQQYFEKVERPSGAVFQRLPILWHMSEERWLHVNGIFLDPDPDLEGGRWPWPDEPAIWNENCVFCHNTAPRPGMVNFAAMPSDADKSFDSRVADLGISCEACHGPGAEHVEAMADPSARYRAYLFGDVDLHIVQPEKLDKERAVSACGQCHGQRLPKKPEIIRQLLETGPSFRSGDRLGDHVDLVSKDTRIDAGDESFALRFWADGTPR
ncbi:MAG: hypothetical protein QF412_09775, partial [Planctomycetota bacterium]|nr:hypothetical protein [Planctomycetota bacterium]